MIPSRFCGRGKHCPRTMVDHLFLVTDSSVSGGLRRLVPKYKGLQGTSDEFKSRSHPLCSGSNVQTPRPFHMNLPQHYQKRKELVSPQQPKGGADLRLLPPQSAARCPSPAWSSKLCSAASPISRAEFCKVSWTAQGVQSASCWQLLVGFFVAAQKIPKNGG